MEFQAQFLPPNAATPPANLAISPQPTWEIAYNHFHHRLRRPLPMMSKVIPTNRPTGADMNHIVWETLSHGDIDAAALK